MPDKTQTLFNLNGKQAQCPTGSNLQAYLEQAGINPKAVVAEVNGIIVEPKSFEEHRINAGDQIEIIHFVGGG
jgi:thiamine biosynthesis protein ThiS